VTPAPLPGRLVGMGVRISRGNFRSRDSHAVASRGLGRVERRVGLLKKLFQREKAPFLAQQEPEAHRNWDGTAGRLLREMGAGFANLLRAGKCVGWIAIVAGLQLFRTTRNSSPP
jgi:hypothetical protein